MAVAAVCGIAAGCIGHLLSWVASTLGPCPAPHRGAPSTAAAKHGDSPGPRQGQHAAGRVPYETMATCGCTIPLAAVGLVLGGYSLAVARDDARRTRSAGGSFAASPRALRRRLGADRGGAAFALRRPRNAVGPLLALAGAAWFVAEWDNPGVGSRSCSRSGSCSAPRARRSSAGRCWRTRTAGSRTARAGGVAVALRDRRCSCSACCRRWLTTRRRRGAAECPDNLLLVHGDADLVDRLSRAGMSARARVGRAARRVAAWRLVRSRPGRRRVVGPVVADRHAPTSCWSRGRSPPASTRRSSATATLERRLWLAQAAALSRLAPGGRLGTAPSRGDTRRRVAGWSSSSAGRASAGGLRDALAGRARRPRHSRSPTPSATAASSTPTAAPSTCPTRARTA